MRLGGWDAGPAGYVSGYRDGGWGRAGECERGDCDGDGCGEGEGGEEGGGGGRVDHGGRGE